MNKIRLQVEPPKWIIDTKGEEEKPIAEVPLPDDNDDDDTLSMISKTSKIDEMRLNWEKQEVENTNKEFVHYQNVLFDGKCNIMNC